MAEKKNVVSENSRNRKGTYSWVPDVPDQRDYLLSAVLKVPAKLPRSVDLRPYCSEVEDHKVNWGAARLRPSRGHWNS